VELATLPGCRRFRNRTSASPKSRISIEQLRRNVMKNVCILCVAISLGFTATATAAFARGGMSMGMGPSHMSVTGGAFGTSAATPGTNSLGTALSSTGAGRPMKGPLLGTNPAIDREEAKVDKMIGSICRGC
jgi:hypothetical protein